MRMAWLKDGVQNWRKARAFNFAVGLIILNKDISCRSPTSELPDVSLVPTTTARGSCLKIQVRGVVPLFEFRFFVPQSLFSTSQGYFSHCRWPQMFLSLFCIFF